LLGLGDLGGEAHQEGIVDLTALMHLEGDCTQAEELGAVLLLQLLQIVGFG
jgi:hypothetical protein